MCLSSYGIQVEAILHETTERRQGEYPIPRPTVRPLGMSGTVAHWPDAGDCRQQNATWLQSSMQHFEPASHIVDILECLGENDAIKCRLRQSALFCKVT